MVIHELDPQLLGIGLEMSRRPEVINPEISHFDAAGNKIGIARLPGAHLLPDYDAHRDVGLRAALARWGIEQTTDSIMVLTGDPTAIEEQGYHVTMDVFEPRGNDPDGLPGGFSTMCGNGVRATAALLAEQDSDATGFVVRTRSGDRRVGVEGDNFVVEMGQLTHSIRDLGRYVDVGYVRTNPDGEYRGSPIPDDIQQMMYTLGIDTTNWWIGLNGDLQDGSIDGEPHVVIPIRPGRISTLQELRQLAKLIGPGITNHPIFPHGINANLVVPVDPQRILCCTHERNLDGPEHSVTASCGTGSTVAGGVAMRDFLRDYEVTQTVVHCTGGDLVIARPNPQSDRFSLKGPAVRIS